MKKSFLTVNWFVGLLTLVMTGVCWGTEIDEYYGFESGDATTAVAGDAGIDWELFLWDNGLGDYYLAWEDDSGYGLLKDLGVTDHGLLTGRADDDHDTGVNSYLTTGRHDGEHDAAYNNALALSGALGGGTIIAHASSTDYHWPRPAQTHTVAKNGTGEFATIAAAVAAANAAASSSAPQEVLVFGGTYDENNLSLNSYVSMRGAIPQQAIIDSSSANPILKLNGTQNRLTGLQVRAGGTGGCVQVTGGVGGVLDIDNCYLWMNGSAGMVVDFNGDDCSMVIHGQTTMLSNADVMIGGKTSGSQLLLYESSVSFIGTNAPDPGVIDIDANYASTPDVMANCVFNMTSLTGGFSPTSFVDWDANELHIRNCLFRVKSASGKTTQAVYAQAGTIYSQGNHIFWTGTAGTEYDFYIEGGAAIYTIGTAYDDGQVGGAGSLNPLDQGEMAAGGLTLSGALTMDGDDTPLLNLRPSGSGPQTIVDIVPQSAIEAGAAWVGRDIDGSLLDSSGASAGIWGDFLDFTGVDQTNNPLIVAYRASMPTNYTSTQDIFAARLAGDGRVVEICNDDHGIKASSATGAAGRFVRSDAATNTAVTGVIAEHLTTGDMVDPFGVSYDYIIQDDAAVGNNIAATVAVRDGADTIGKWSVFCGVNGAEENFIIHGDKHISMPNAQSVGTGFAIDGQDTGAWMYNDAAGFVVNGADGHPLIVGNSITVELGDNAGVDDFNVSDSDGVTVAHIDSNGRVHTDFITGSGGVDLLERSGALDVTLRGPSAGSSRVNVEAKGNMRFAIDTDNNQTDRTYEWRHNGELGAGVELMRLGETLGFVLTSDALFNREITYGQTYTVPLAVPLTSAGLGPSKNPNFVQFIDNGAGSTGIFQWAFDATGEEELNFSITIDGGYSEGTDITPIMHWAPDGTGGVNELVQWGLEYDWKNGDDIFGPSTITTTDASSAGTATTSGDTTMLDRKNYSSIFPAIDGTGMERHSILVGRVFRDATDPDDAYGPDAYGILLDIHIVVDQPGDPT